MRRTRRSSTGNGGPDEALVPVLFQERGDLVRGEAHARAAERGNAPADDRLVTEFLPEPMIPVGSRKPKVLQPGSAGLSICFRSVDPWVRLNTRVLCKAKSFGRDLGVNLCLCSVAVFEDVVVVVQVGELLGQRQLVAEALVDPEGQLAWCQFASQHPGGKCSRGGFLSGNAARWVESEAQFVECRWEEVGDVVIRFRSCARGQDPQGGTVETGNECITGSGDDVGCADLAHAPEGGTVL